MHEKKGFHYHNSVHTEATTKRVHSDVLNRVGVSGSYEPIFNLISYSMRAEWKMTCTQLETFTWFYWDIILL